MELFGAILADFTEEDWQEVKDEMKKFIFEKFKSMWEEYYIYDHGFVESAIIDPLHDLISDQFRELLEQEDMKKVIMQTILKNISGEVE